MKRPIWFHADSIIGRVPLHWTPCKWQGWVLVGVFILTLTGIMVKIAPTQPGKATGIVFALAALLIAAAALTDDRHAP